jgi:hypothetical protein
LKPVTIALLLISAGLLVSAVYIIPWDAVRMLTSPIPQFASYDFGKQVSFTSHGKTIPFTVNGTILLLAKGPISADNPVIAEVYITHTLSLENLTELTNTTRIAVGFNGSLAFPLTQT